MDADSYLGRADFDKRLVAHFANQFKEKHNKYITGNARALRKLETTCERVKRSLSMTTKTTIDIDALYDGINYYSTITREEVTNIVLIGGSTRIPKVQQLLQEFCGGKELSKNVNPDEAVALGAAMIGKGGPLMQEILHVEVLANSIDIETGGGLMTTMLKKNTCIPRITRMEFTTYPNQETSMLLNLLEHTCISRITRMEFTTYPNQETSVFFNLCEGEEPRAAHNHLIAVYELTDLPPRALRSSRGP